LINGKIEVNGEAMNPGDGLKIADLQSLDINVLEKAEFLFFDLN